MAVAVAVVGYRCGLAVAVARVDCIYHAPGHLKLSHTQETYAKMRKDAETQHAKVLATVQAEYNKSLHDFEVV